MRIHVGLILGLGLMAPLAAKDIVIGQVAPFSDGAVSIATQYRSGVELYFDLVNRSGGVNGSRLRLATRDRESDAASVIGQTRALVKEHHPIALVGMMGTGSMAILLREKVLADLGVPVVGIRTGAVALHAPVEPLLFHTRASYKAEAEKAVSYLATIGYTRFAILAESSPFGNEASQHFAAAIQSRRLKLVGSAGYSVSSLDLSAAAKQIAALQPDAVVTAGSSAAIADFYVAIRQIQKTLPVMTLSTVDGESIIKRIGKSAARGLGIARVVPDPGNRRSAVVREFQDSGHRIRGSTFQQTQVELEGYIAAKVLVEALRRCGPDPSGAKLRAELERMRAFDIGGILIEYSRADHTGSKFVDVGIIGPEGRLLH